MKKRLATIATVVGFLSAITVGPARAEVFFQLSLSDGAGDSVNATLGATPLGGGVYGVDSITGTFDGQAITGLYNPNSLNPDYSMLPSGISYNPPPAEPKPGIYDNLIFPGSSLVVDDYGLLFTVSGMQYPVNIFSQNGLYLVGTRPNQTNGNSPSWVSKPVAPDGHVSLTPVPVPEPSTLLLLGCAIAAAAGFAWRRKRFRYLSE